MGGSGQRICFRFAGGTQSGTIIRPKAVIIFRKSQYSCVNQINAFNVRGAWGGGGNFNSRAPGIEQTLSGPSQVGS